MSGRPISRRGFVQGALAGGALLGMGGLRPVLGAWADTSGKPKAGKIGDYQISLAEWSLHRRLFADRARTADMNLDFPRMAREEFGIEAVEFVNQFFADKAKDEKYLAALKQRTADFEVTPVLIMIDLHGMSLSDKDEAARKKAVDAHKEWVDAAAVLGCHAIRVNTGDNYSPTDVKAAADGCGALTEYGKSNGISIICENHGGPSSDPDSLIALMKGVDMPEFGTLPDFGNFPKNADGSYKIDIYEAIARMMPYARGVSAKSHVFGADGLESNIDYPRMLKIVTDAGYKGFVGIEYEGDGPEAEGIKATKALLEKLKGAEYKG
jgi:sugar phosphate isomerase/epimerase